MLPVPITNSTLSVRTRANTTPSPKTLSETTKRKRQPTRMKTLEPDATRTTRIPQPQQVKLTDGIGKYIARNAEEVTWLGWTEFVRRQRRRGYFPSLSAVDHPARCLLRQYNHCGAPVILMTGECTEEERLVSLERGPHKSAIEHAPFIRE